MNPYGFGGFKPQIPSGLMHTMKKVESGSVFSQENGGQWVRGADQKTSFQGVVLPVTDKDLMRDTGGTMTRNTVKIYTNGSALNVGARIEDKDGAMYTITQELDHNSIHPMKRYLAERQGKATVR